MISEDVCQRWQSSTDTNNCLYSRKSKDELEVVADNEQHMSLQCAVPACLEPLLWDASVGGLACETREERLLKHKLDVVE